MYKLKFLPSIRHFDMNRKNVECEFKFAPTLSMLIEIYQSDDDKYNVKVTIEQGSENNGWTRVPCRQKKYTSNPIDIITSDIQQYLNELHNSVKEYLNSDVEVLNGMHDGTECDLLYINIPLNTCLDELITPFFNIYCTIDRSTESTKYTVVYDKMYKTTDSEDEAVKFLKKVYYKVLKQIDNNLNRMLKK